jgi:hypothetical protein
MATFDRFDPECVRAQYWDHYWGLRTPGEKQGKPKRRSFMDAWQSDQELVEVYGQSALYSATPSDDTPVDEFMRRNKRRFVWPSHRDPRKASAAIKVMDAGDRKLINEFMAASDRVPFRGGHRYVKR